jgi:hypothetical protein
VTSPDNVSVTRTAKGSSDKEIAVAVIADKLGIPETSVADDLSLGEAWREIAMVVTFKTGKAIISTARMKASDLFEQL